jgi:hypothetical protein
MQRSRAGITGEYYVFLDKVNFQLQVIQGYPVSNVTVEAISLFDEQNLAGVLWCLRIWSRITSRIAAAVVSFLRSKFWSKGYGMDGYAAEVEQKMQRFFGWLSEKDRRRYAAVEAAKLGHGGVEYIARVLACDPKTIRQGLRELKEAEDTAVGRSRKKGAAARHAPAPSRP